MAQLLGLVQDTAPQCEAADRHVLLVGMDLCVRAGMVTRIVCVCVYGDKDRVRAGVYGNKDCVHEGVVVKRIVCVWVWW